MSRRKHSTTADPMSFPQRFQAIADRSEPLFRALNALRDEYEDIVDELLELHPEVDRWSSQQARIEALYGATVCDRLIDAADA